jgi:hypothetical protein
VVEECLLGDGAERVGAFDDGAVVATAALLGVVFPAHFVVLEPVYWYAECCLGFVCANKSMPGFG